MALTSTDTLDTVIDQLLLNYNWYGDSTKAADFLEAATWLFTRYPQSQSINARSHTFELDHLMNEAKRAADYLHATHSNRVTRTVVEF